MDADHFDALSRSLTTTRSRRSLARLLSGLILGGVLSALGATEALARCRPRCGPCKRCQNGRCRRKAEGATCGQGRVCLAGICTCPSGTEPCGNACVATCGPDEARNPTNCTCCLTNGRPCDARPCCGDCETTDQAELCFALRDGDLCSFDAQCESGDCFFGSCSPGQGGG